MSRLNLNPKVANGAIAGALATIGTGLLNRYTSYHPTPEEAGAMVVVLTGIVGYFTPAA